MKTFYHNICFLDNILLLFQKQVLIKKKQYPNNFDAIIFEKYKNNTTLAHCCSELFGDIIKLGPAGQIYNLPT